MSEKPYFDELVRALARPDADQMCRHLDTFAEFHKNDEASERTDEYAEAVDEILYCYHEDPEKAFAYVILGLSRSDDVRFLRLLGCGPLEHVLHDPSAALLERIVAEAHKSDRFRWLLSNPFKIAIAPRAWEAIEKFRLSGPHEEPPADKLPRQK